MNQRSLVFRVINIVMILGFMLSSAGIQPPTPGQARADAAPAAVPVQVPAIVPAWKPAIQAAPKPAAAGLARVFADVASDASVRVDLTANKLFLLNWTHSIQLSVILTGSDFVAHGLVATTDSSGSAVLDPSPLRLAAGMQVQVTDPNHDPTPVPTNTNVPAPTAAPTMIPSSTPEGTLTPAPTIEPSATPLPTARREFTIPDLGITHMDRGAGQLSGTGPASGVVQLNLPQAGTGNFTPQPVTADGSGQWTYTYPSAPDTFNGLSLEYTFQDQPTVSIIVQAPPYIFLDMKSGELDIFNVPVSQSVGVMAEALDSQDHLLASTGMVAEMESGSLVLKGNLKAAGYTPNPGDSLLIINNVDLWIKIPVSGGVDFTVTAVDSAAGTAAGSAPVGTHVVVQSQWNLFQASLANAGGQWSVSGLPGIFQAKEPLRVFLEDNQGNQFGMQHLPPGSILAAPPNQQISGSRWNANEPVVVRVFDNAAHSKLLLEQSVNVDGNGNFSLDYSPFNLRLETGNSITVTDAAGQSSLIVANISVTQTDYGANTVYGTADVPAGSRISARQDTYLNQANDNYQAESTVNPNGSWMLHFDDNVGWDRLVAGPAIWIYAYDSAGNATLYEYDPRTSQVPHLEVLEDHLLMRNLSPDTDITLRVYRDANQPELLMTSEGSLRTDGNGYANINLEAYQVYIEAGNKITVDEVTGRHMEAVVGLISLTSVNLAAAPKTMGGDSIMYQFIGVEIPGCMDMLTRADAAGHWTYQVPDWANACADPTAPVRAYTLDGQFNRVYTGPTRHSLHVNILKNTVEGGYFSENMVVQLRDLQGQVIPGSTRDTPLNFRGEFIYTPPAGVKLAPGMIVEATNTFNLQLTTTVVPLSLDSVDFGTDVLQGKSAPGARINIWFGDLNHIYGPLADANGDWHVNVRDYLPNYDMNVHSGIMVFVQDGNGNWTYTEYVAPPMVRVDKTLDWVDLEGWPASTNLHVEYLLNNIVQQEQTVTTGPNGIAQFTAPLALQKGLKLRVTDLQQNPNTVREVIIPELSILQTNLPGGSLSGTAEPNRSLFLQMGAGESYRQANVQTDADGHWSYSAGAALSSMLGLMVHDSLDQTGSEVYIDQPPYIFLNLNGELEIHNLPRWQDVTVAIINSLGNPRFTPVTLSPAEGAGTLVIENGKSPVFKLDLAGIGYTPTEGDTVTISVGNQTLITAVIPPLQDIKVKTIDPNTGLVTGSAQFYSNLVVKSGWSDRFVATTADINGDWSATFKDKLDPREPVEVFYEDGQGNRYGVRHSTPGTFTGSVSNNFIYGSGWASNLAVTVRIFENSDVNAKLLFSQDMTTDGNGNFLVDYNKFQSKLKLGNFITVTSRDTGQTDLTLVDIQVTHVDYVAHTVSGTATAEGAGTLAGMRLVGLQDSYPGRSGNWWWNDQAETTVAPDGTWTVKFFNAHGGNYDLQAGPGIGLDAYEPNGNSTHYDYVELYNSHLEANLVSDQIMIINFSDHPPINLHIYNSADGVLWESGPDWAIMPWSIPFNYDQHHIRLKPGMKLAAEDGAGRKLQMTIESGPTLDAWQLDHTPKMISGTAPAGRFVGVEGDGCFNEITRAGADGKWTYAVQDWADTCVDPATPLHAYVLDDAFNRSRVDPIRTTVKVELSSNSVKGDQFSENQTAAVVIRSAPGGSVLASQNDVPLDAQGKFSYSPSGVTLASPMQVEVTDNHTQQQYTMAVVPLSLEQVDMEEDVVGGKAAPGALISLRFDDGKHIYGTQADANGNWTVDINAAIPGYRIDIYRTITAYIEDVHGDWTYIERPPQPYVWVDVVQDRVHIERFQAPATLRVYASPTDSTLIYTNTYNTGNGILNDDKMPDLLPGMYITVTGHDNYVSTITTRPLTFDSTEWATTGLTYGTTAPGARVYVNGGINGSPWQAFFADDKGHWQYQFDPFQHPPQVTTCQANGNCTWADAFLPPLLEASLSTDEVHLTSFKPFRPVTLKVYPPSAIVPQYSTTLTPDRWGSTSVALGPLGINLSSGWKIQSEDPNGTQNYEVVLESLRITALDRPAYTIRGTAAPNKDLAVIAENGVGSHLEQHVKADSQGGWTLNYESAGWVLQNDMQLYARIYAPNVATRYDYRNIDLNAWNRIDLSLPQVQQLDPQLYSSIESAQVIDQLFAGLVKIGPDGTIQPCLAQSWTISTDRRTYTFKLRPGLTWSDGNPITANNVQDSFRRMFTLGQGSGSYTYYLTSLFSAATDIRALDASRVEFKLNQPAAYFLTLMSAPYAHIVPIDPIITFGSRWTLPGFILSSGAYVLVDWQELNRGYQQGFLKLRRNPNYFDAANVKIELVYIWLRDINTAFNMYQHGALNTVLIPDENQLKNEVQYLDQPYTYYLGFNTSKPFVNDARIRQALSLTVNRVDLVQTVLAGTGRPAKWFTAPEVVGAPSDQSMAGKGVGYDPVKARQLIAQYLLDHPGMSAADIKIEYWHDPNPYHQSIAQAIIDSWQNELGISVSRHDTLSWPDYLSQVRGPDAPAVFRLGWGPDYPDASAVLDTVFRTGGFINQPGKGIQWTGGHYSNFETLINSARQETNPTTRQQEYSQADTILVNQDAVVIPLFWNVRREAVSASLLRTSGPNNPWGQIADWRLQVAEKDAPRAAAASLASLSGKFTVTIPAGSFGEDARLVLTNANRPMLSGRAPVTEIFDLRAESIASGEQIATLAGKNLGFQASYSEPLPAEGAGTLAGGAGTLAEGAGTLAEGAGTLAGMLEDSLAVYVFNDASASWQRLPGTLDMSKNLVTLQAPFDRHAIYALLGSYPGVQANLSTQAIRLLNFAPNQPARLRIFDAGGALLYDRQHTVEGDGFLDIPSDERVINAQAAPLQVGGRVEVTQGSQTYGLTLAFVRVEGVDFNTQSMWGSAGPDQAVMAEAFKLDAQGRHSVQRFVTADGAGHWTADFSNEPNFNLRDWQELNAAIPDGRNDSYATWLGQPALTVFEHQDRLQVVHLMPLQQVQVTYQQGGGTVFGPETLTADGWGTLDLTYSHSGMRIEPGMTIHVTNGSSPLQLAVAEIHIGTIDPVGDTVSGTAPAGAVVKVGLAATQSVQVVTANDSGDWQASFAGQSDLTAASILYASILDAQGNTTTGDNLPCRSLTLSILPANRGTISASPEGNCAAYSYTDGVQVDLYAQAGASYRFNNWSGGLSGTTAEQAISMNADQAITANFSLQNNLNPTSAPVLYAPLDKTVLNDNHPLFLWNGLTAAGGASMLYELQVANASSFSQATLIGSVSTSDPSASLNTSPPDGTLYWRVRGVNTFTDGGQTQSFPGPWSAARSLTLDTAPPAAPTLLTPISGSDVTGTPVFNWNAPAGADHYLFCIQTASDVSNCTGGGQSSTASSYRPAGLAFNIYYYWKVRACDAAGNCGGWSSEWTTRILTARPAKPGLASPANNAVFNQAYAAGHSQLQLSWNAAPDAAGYVLQWSTDPNLLAQHQETIAAASTTFSWDLASQPDGLIYWRVAGTNSDYTDPALLAWSDVRAFTLDRQAPSLPLLVSPADGTSLVGTPVLNWTALNATSYNVWVYDSNSILIQQFYGIAANTTILPLLAPGQYTWKVSAGDAAGNWSAETAQWSFSVQAAIPAAPTLAAPADKAVMNMSVSNLSWIQPAYAIQAEVQVSSSATFASALLDQVVNDTHLSVTLPNGSFYWRVRGLNTYKQAGAWSSPRSFTLDTTAPQAPGWVSPSLGASTSGTPQLRWSAPSGAVSYGLRYKAQGGEFAQVFNLRVSNFTPGSLPSALWYVWQVQACDAAGNCSDWSSEFTFYVNPLVPGAPQLSAPANKALIGAAGENAINLAWNPASEAAAYHVEISMAANFSTLTQAMDVPGMQHVLVNLVQPNAEPVYYWRVRAVNADGVFGAWSSVFSFTLDARAPTAPAQKAPADGATVAGVPTLSWNASVGAQTYQYRIYLRSAPAAEPALYLSPVLTTTSHKPDLGDNGDYQWQVRACDAAGNWSDWGSSFRLVINSTLPARVGLISPVDGSYNTTRTQELSWVGAAFADYYQLQVATDSLFQLPTFSELSGLKIADLNYTLAFPADNKYFWRVRGCYDAAGLSMCGGWSAAYALWVDSTPPVVPVLSAPADLADTIGTPTYRWQVVTGAKSYEVAITSPDDAAYRLNVKGLSGASFKPVTAQMPGNYTWMVRACDSAGNCSAWAQPWMVNVQPATPPAPVLLAPATRLLTRDALPVLRWNPALYAASYQLEVSTSPLFIPGSSTLPVTVNAPEGSSLAYPFTTPLSSGVRYWHVRGCFNDGTQDTCGAWSATWNFTIDVDSPASPKLITPLDNVTVAGLPTFVWLPATTDTKQYTLVLERLDQGGDSVAETLWFPGLSGLSFRPPMLQPATYHWKLQAIDAAGNVGDFSGVRTLIVQPLTPAAPTRLAPANRLITQDPAPAFNWSGVVYGVKYELQISNNSVFLGPNFLMANNVLVTYTNLDTPGFNGWTAPADGLYYWRVRAVNSLHNAGPYSTAFTYTVDRIPPPQVAAATMSPANNASVSATPGFSWRVSNGAVRYNFVLSNTPSSLDPVIRVNGLVTLNYKPPKQAAGDYYWMVQAVDAAGNASPWSTALKLTIH